MGKRIDSYRKRYILLRLFLRWKQKVILDILSAGILRKSELSTTSGEPFLDTLYLRVNNHRIREQIALLIALRERLVRMWLFEIQSDLHLFRRLDPSESALHLAYQKFRQAIDAAGGTCIEGEVSVRMLKMRIFKDMERIRTRIVPISYFQPRKESYEDASSVSEEILVEETNPEELLIMKESLLC